MAENGLNDSQSIFSSVLGLVSREIQDFVVTAVTGSSTTLSHQSSQSHGPTKHKRSRSMNSNRNALPTEQAKRKRRPSSPHPKNVADDERAENPADDDRETGTGDSSKQGDRWSFDDGSDARPGPSKRIIKASRRVSSDGGFFKMPELPSRPTMPGSLWPRSPTPAEWSRKTLHPEVPAPAATVKSGLSTTPTTSPAVRRDSSLDSSRPPKRARSRRRSSVRFAPQVVRHPPPPERSPTPGVKENPLPEEDTAKSQPDAAPPSPRRVKVEEEDEIIILDKMPTPPPASTSSSRGRSTQVSKSLGSRSGTASSSQNPSSRKVAPLPAEESNILPPNIADMSISELTSNTKTSEKGKGKEVDRQVTDNNVTTQPRDGSDSNENDKIRQLEEEIERLKNELSIRSSTNSSTSVPPPAPPAPPLPPPGYIAIPATSWANGQHPSQRGLPQAIPKARKSLQSIVPAETMEKFLSELKTIKLRNTGSGTGSTVSPYTMRQNANSQAASQASSEISTGLQTLRAGLKRKRISEDAADELQNGLHEAVRRRFEASSPTQEVHESHEDESFVSQAPSATNSSQSQSSQNGRSQRGNDPMAISWSFPGPMRPVRASQPENTSTSSSIPARERGLHRSLAAPPVPLPIPGQGGSDMTTPSLCSDTEVDAENEQDSLEQYPVARDEVLTPPAEEDLRHVQPLAGPSKHPRSPPKVTNAPGRKSDLRLEELNTLSKAEASQEERDSRRSKPAARIFQVRRVSHPPPVQGSPNVFLARQPKSPLPSQHVRKPLPPARASSRREPVPAQQPSLNDSQASSSTFRLHSSAIILQPEPDNAEGDGAPEPLLRDPTPETAAAYEEYTVPVQLSTPPLESSAIHRIPTPGLKFSQVQDTKGKRRIDDSLSLDEEIRRVAANERIADLDIDFELEGITDAEALRALEEDTTVYVGLGTRPRGSGFVSGGGAAGVAVTMDPPHRRQQSGDASSKMKSRIPVPKPLSRSR
ncbi:hypothetical protein FS837_007617 [Tulasnella sp. UAMH 9824]|nr:hypothetical protein FS837_007617 [Tulasnella sp. UAMH 9824]